jgi:hypothetical protein
MSSIAQPSLFSWENVEASPEILRLERLLDALPDEKLLAALEAGRKGRRNDFPLRALWRSAVAGVALGHPTTASLIRELKRNAELREVCGFDAVLQDRAVPPDYVYSRFFARLEQLDALVREMFERLVERLGQLLPDMGRRLAVDSKALVARGARPADADTGTKRYESVREDGSVSVQLQSWFGWKLHLLVDADYELPLAFEVTEASAGDSPRLMPLVESYRHNQPALHERAETVAADKAYDDGEDKARLFDRHDMVPLIPPRDTTPTRSDDGMQPLDPARHDAIYIGATGEVVCRTHPFEADPQKAYTPMQFCGYEKDRDTLKFRCPAATYGIACGNRDACRCRPGVRDGSWGRVVRVPRQRDPRVLLPMHHHSRTFAHAYKSRTAVERFFSRLDNVHGFEDAIVKSRQRMETRVSLALIAMLVTAQSWIEIERPQHMRRILCAA